MRFEILRHVRDHAKAVGPAHHLLLVIATHVNYHTGEARVSVDRMAYALDVTPRHVRRLLTHLITSGQLLVRRSPGRHANTYQLPLLKLSTGVGGDETNPDMDVQVHPANPDMDVPQPGHACQPVRVMKERKRKTVAKRCGWGSCEAGVCPHEINFCAPHAGCRRCASG